MRTIGIVGNGSDKFTPKGEKIARQRIRDLLRQTDSILVSGHSPVGGIDIWSEEEADSMGVPKDIYEPEIHQWNPPDGYGYKARNLAIASSDEVHCIVADVYPREYSGMKFDLCYHCNRTDHVKSGGCWTMKKAVHGNGALWIVKNY